MVPPTIQRPETSRPADVLVEILDVLADIRDDQRRVIVLLEERQEHARPIADPRHVALLVGISRTLDDHADLGFTCDEVLGARQWNAELDQALAALGLETTAAVGALFRSLKDRDVGTFTLRRSGKGWTLLRR